ncbi:hypothetical protein NZD88_06375 [Chryseobacterium antibioticum]|uniref:DUF4935 domain-containing protein n=1 Tax=Chryseobacterium pyrolae TaxID=2987481 RepID=A0ABT2IEV7_9FLAO|nr:hypothetical protein [Chryseobacterium pyrolae]MCT2407163.1 hypothetical protein [Chryseobacterium pyrolae]
MIRIYCDKNIYSFLKEEKRNFNPQLKELMEDLKDIFIFTYSHAHHQDLSNSDASFWKEDLDLLEKYVKNHYFDYDGIKRKTNCLLAKPTESFYDTDFTVAKNFHSPTTNIMDSLFPTIEGEEDDEFSKITKNLLDNLFNIPIPNFQKSDLDEKEKQLSEKYLPEDENLTVGSMLEHFFKFGNKLLTDRHEVIELKKMMEEYVNSDKYSFEKWKDQFDEKFKENFGGNSFTDIMKKTFESVNHYNDYDKFILFFNSLELHNVTKDKPLRKSQSLGSINTDANHAWYASYSDILVTDDKGLATKAYLTFKFFKIQTKIYDVKEFLNNRNLFLQQEENDIKSFFETLDYELKNSLILSNNDDNATDHSIILKNHHKFFNYFNRISYSQNSIKLYCQRYYNSNFIMYKEAEILTNKLINLFGVDFENKGYYDLEKDDPNDDIIRVWNFKNTEIVLGTAYNNGGECYCLDIIIIPT